MPHANAIFIANLEFFGGILLVLGLFTRPAAALLGATMVVASMTGDKDDLLKAITGYNMPGVLGVTPIVFGLLCMWLLIYGPGLISIDAIIRKVLHIDRTDSREDASPNVTKAEML
jgi:putative oxidoreductase